MVSLLFTVVVLLTIAVNDIHFSQIERGLQRSGDLFGAYRYSKDLVIGSKHRITLKTER